MNLKVLAAAALVSLGLWALAIAVAWKGLRLLGAALVLFDDGINAP